MRRLPLDPVLMPARGARARWIRSGPELVLTWSSVRLAKALARVRASLAAGPGGHRLRVRVGPGTWRDSAGTVGGVLWFSHVRCRACGFEQVHYLRDSERVRPSQLVHVMVARVVGEGRGMSCREWTVSRVMAL